MERDQKLEQLLRAHIPASATPQDIEFYEAMIDICLQKLNKVKG
jgi:hypothetical protein